MSKHTSGPWHAVPFLVGSGMTVKDGTGHSVVTTASFRPWEETEANARLIAAAPDLLSALREFVAINDRPHDPTRGTWDAAIVMARAAIARATQVPDPEAEGGHHG